jgi:hypothetical protein
MPRMRFETAIPVFERSRPTSDHFATVMKAQKIATLKMTNNHLCYVNVTLNKYYQMTLIYLLITGFLREMRYWNHSPESEKERETGRQTRSMVT